MSLFSRSSGLGFLHSFPTRRSSDLIVCSAFSASSVGGRPRDSQPNTSTSPRAYSTSVCFVAADRKSTRLNSSHITISYAVSCLKKKSHLHLRPPGSHLDGDRLNALH